MSSGEPEISVVVPVFNEAPNLRALFLRTVAVLEQMGRSLEVVMVNDGSTDDSLDVIKELRAGDGRLRVVNLLRNFGQTPALYAGFAHVRGPIIAGVQLIAIGLMCEYVGRIFVEVQCKPYYVVKEVLE